MDHNTIEAQLQTVEQECRRYLGIVPNDQTATQILNAAQNIRQRIGNDLVAYGGEVRNLHQHIVNLFEQSRVQYNQQQQQQQQQQYQQQQQQYQQQYQQQQQQQQQPVPPQQRYQSRQSKQHQQQREQYQQQQQYQQQPQQQQGPTYYDTLGVQRTATKAEISKAYKKLALKNHPDKGGDEEKMKEISNAYGVLKDESRKGNYDRWLATGAPGKFEGGKKTKKNRQHNKRIKSTRRKSTRRKSIHRR